MDYKSEASTGPKNIRSNVYISSGRKKKAMHYQRHNMLGHLEQSIHRDVNATINAETTDLIPGRTLVW